MHTSPPNRPPALPPTGGGDSEGKGDGSKLEHRVTKVETATEFLQKDVTDIKVSIKDFRGDVKGEFSELRRDIKADLNVIRADLRTDFRVTFGATITVALGLAVMMAKGFHWI